MGNPIAYYKWLRLGDYLLAPPHFSAQPETVEFRGTVFGDRATPVERGANQSHRCSLAMAMHRGFYSPSETVRAFDQRKVAFLASMTAASQDSNALGYNSRGDLAFIWDDSTDMTLLNGAVSAGTPVSIVVDDDINPTVGDYILITAGTTWEITEVEGWTVGTKTILADLTQGFPDAGATVVARLNWHFPDCWRVSQVDLSSRQGRGTAVNATSDVTVEFQGVEDPVT